MNTIDSSNLTMEEAFSEALKLGADITIECSDGKFVLQSGALLKITKEGISCWNGKTWDCLTE